MSFKVGDKVRCKDGRGTLSLRAGEIYTVEALQRLRSGEPGVRLQGVTAAPWFATRFELYEAAPPAANPVPEPVPVSQLGAIADRKSAPLARGCLDYFPAALAAVAHVSKVGNDKHNPGEEMHHARGKSMDHADCAIRHLADRGTVDPETGLRHSALAAWRALANLQEELEREGLAPMARGARAA